MTESQKRRGWILNLDRDDSSSEVERAQRPVIVFDDGEVVFEVWKWNQALRRWFVLSWERDTKAEAQGVIYYSPDEVPERLRARVIAMRKAAGLAA